MVAPRQNKRKEPKAKPSVLVGLISLAAVVGIAAAVSALLTGGMSDIPGQAQTAVQDASAAVEAGGKGGERKLNRQAVIAARVSSMLSELTLERERLAEFSTMEEVSRAMPTKFYPSRERIRTAQRGFYEGVAQRLGHIAGEPLTDPVKPYSELSRREKLLLFSDWAGTDYIDQPVYVALMARMNMADISFVPDFHTFASLWTEADMENLAAIREASGGDHGKMQMLIADEWLPLFVSPVSYTCFEPWHSEWAAGHGFIVEIADKGERQRLVEAIVSTQIEMRSAAIGPSDVDRMLKGESTASPGPQESSYNYAKFYYYRIYGEHEGSVIAEGIYQMDSYDWVQRRWTRN
jgi:hypothetical protein